jgi:hypothetical protein
VSNKYDSGGCLRHYYDFTVFSVFSREGLSIFMADDGNLLEINAKLDDTLLKVFLLLERYHLYEKILEEKLKAVRFPHEDFSSFDND